MNYLYLHGFASGLNSKKAVFLAQKFKELKRELILCDLNHGGFEHFSLTRAKNQVLKLIYNMNGEAVTLIGSSLGGLLSLILAEEELKVKKLILLAPAIEINRLWPNIVGLDNLAKWEKYKYLPIYNTYLQQEVNLSYNFILDLKKYQDSNFQRKLPSLILHGINDATIPYQVSVGYNQKNHNSKLQLLNAEHGLEDNLTEVWQAISKFI